MLRLCLTRCLAGGPALLLVTVLVFTVVRLIPGARAYVLPDGGHLYPNVHGAEFRRVMTSFLLESR